MFALLNDRSEQRARSGVRGFQPEGPAWSTRESLCLRLILTATGRRTNQPSTASTLRRAASGRAPRRQSFASAAHSLACRTPVTRRARHGPLTRPLSL